MIAVGLVLIVLLSPTRPDVVALSIYKRSMAGQSPPIETEADFPAIWTRWSVSKVCTRAVNGTPWFLIMCLCVHVLVE